MDAARSGKGAGGGSPFSWARLVLAGMLIWAVMTMASLTPHATWPPSPNGQGARIGTWVVARDRPRSRPVAHRPTLCVRRVHEREMSSGAATRLVMTRIGLRAKRCVGHAALARATTSYRRRCKRTGRWNGGRRPVQTRRGTRPPAPWACSTPPTCGSQGVIEGGRVKCEPTRLKGGVDGGGSVSLRAP